VTNIVRPPAALQTTTDDKRQRAKQKGLPIRQASNNVINLHQLTSHRVGLLAVQHGDRIVTIDYYDVISPYLCSCPYLRQMLTIDIRNSFAPESPQLIK